MFLKIVPQGKHGKEYSMGPNGSLTWVIYLRESSTLSIFCHVSRTMSQGQQSEPRLRPQPLIAPPGTVVSQPSDIVSLKSSGSGPRPSADGICPEDLPWILTQFPNHFNWIFSMWRSSGHALNPSQMIELHSLYPKELIPRPCPRSSFVFVNS